MAGRIAIVAVDRNRDGSKSPLVWELEQLGRLKRARLRWLLDRFTDEDLRFRLREVRELREVPGWAAGPEGVWMELALDDPVLGRIRVVGQLDVPGGEWFSGPEAVFKMMHVGSPSYLARLFAHYAEEGADE